MEIAEDILSRIAELPGDWHGAGTLSGAVIEAFVRLTGGQIDRSVETGAGKSTLLLSHISRRHTVFALDLGDSITITTGSDLFRRERVEFVAGPTQQTLREYRFEGAIDFALIDGPHGFPFPYLEYHALYPHLREGGWLVVDDIHIPTIAWLFEFLREEPMFELIEVVGTTAMFRRTAAPTFDPLCDGWWEQPYNTSRFPVAVTTSAPARGEANAYRERLVPLIRSWREDGTRVAIFGIGPHTRQLFASVPELEEVQIAGYLDSDPARDGSIFRGRPVHLPSWAEGHADVVLCSSFEHELVQMALLDRVAVKVVPSHVQPLRQRG